MDTNGKFVLAAQHKQGAAKLCTVHDRTAATEHLDGPFVPLFGLTVSRVGKIVRPSGSPRWLGSLKTNIEDAEDEKTQVQFVRNKDDTILRVKKKLHKESQPPVSATRSLQCCSASYLRRQTKTPSEGQVTFRHSRYTLLSSQVTEHCKQWAEPFLLLLLFKGIMAVFALVAQGFIDWCY